MDFIVSSIDKFVRWVGYQSAWLNPLLVVLICMDVLQRYMFNQSYNWILEAEWHIFGLIFLLSSAFTLQVDKHVRVDVFYQRYSIKNKAITDIICTILLMVPWCLVGIVTCYNYASNSFYIKECSPNPGGLPYWFIIKYFIVICFVLMLLQAFATTYKNIKTLLK